MNFKAKLLKKSLIVMVLILVAGTTFAASGETIIIGGAVPLILDLAVVTTADTDNLDLSSTTDGVDQSVVIANITITTNNTAGWDLIAISENDAVMTNADGDDISYSLTYGGAGTTGAATPNSTTGILLGEEADLSGDVAALSINYQRDTGYPAGYYSDQVALILRAK